MYSFHAREGVGLIIHFGDHSTGPQIWMFPFPYFKTTREGLIQIWRQPSYGWKHLFFYWKMFYNGQNDGLRRPVIVIAERVEIQF